MSGTNPAQAIAGLSAAQRATLAARETKPKPVAKPPTGHDEAADSVELSNAVRSNKGNADEESHEDRQEHPPYERDKKPAIDVEG
ncbi:MAG: hypothetical protein AABZ53_01035 [Planctomycetota bacterium]